MGKSWWPSAFSSGCRRLGDRAVPVAFWAGADKLAALVATKPRGFVSSSNSALAQLVEQLTVNQRVAGSSPAGGAISFKELASNSLIANFPFPVPAQVADFRVPTTDDYFEWRHLLQMRRQFVQEAILLLPIGRVGTRRCSIRRVRSSALDAWVTTWNLSMVTSSWP